MFRLTASAFIADSPCPFSGPFVESADPCSASRHLSHCCSHHLALIHSRLTGHHLSETELATTELCLGTKTHCVQFFLITPRVKCLSAHEGLCSRACAYTQPLAYSPFSNLGKPRDRETENKTKPSHNMKVLLSLYGKQNNNIIRKSYCRSFG